MLVAQLRKIEQLRALMGYESIQKETTSTAELIKHKLKDKNI
ncbi:hypothetical protein [Nostoc sp. CHAB 5715]|nr:hypothetical protein [Nostoc sp. CHAB 5715]